MKFSPKRVLTAIAKIGLFAAALARRVPFRHAWDFPVRRTFCFRDRPYHQFNAEMAETLNCFEIRRLRICRVRCLYDNLPHEHVAGLSILRTNTAVATQCQ